MKKILTLMMAAALMIGFTACEKDDDGPGGGNGGNIFQIGNKTYTIGAACCYWGIEDEYVWYDLWFANKQLWNDVGNWDVVPREECVNGFEINVYDLYADTDTPGKIKDGTYTFDDDDGYGDLVHDGYSDYAFYDENGDLADEYTEFGQGNVDKSNLVIEVKNISGNIYEIKATGGVDENGNAINIYYKGEVDMFER